MTKFLSRALQAPEPFFRLGLQRLEAANGHSGTDIRYTTEVARDSKIKLAELGLDPNDTTPEELYHAMQERVKEDDRRLTRTLRTLAATHVSAEADAVAGIIDALKQLPESRRSFALRAGVLRAVMKKVPPKKAMKQLGYRSLDSFLKHEPAASVLAAATLSEDHHWQKRYLAELKRLRPADFESRSITITSLNSKRWSDLAERAVREQKHNLISMKELGAIAFLPLSTGAPGGATTASLVLALHELNEIRAAGTFLKLNQVRPDFGEMVRKIAREEPALRSQLLDQHVPWNLIQRYYAQRIRKDGEEVFEPHLQYEDMAWHPVETALSKIEPSMDFWRSSASLGLLHEQGPVSCNIADAALNYCNRLPFERRMARYFQRSLWHDLLMRYLQHDAVEQAVLHELQPQLAEEFATA